MTERAVAPLDRFAAVAADPMTLEVVGQRVMEGETLKQIARSWQVPVMRFVEWVVNDAFRCGVYQAALKVRADELAHEALRISDEQELAVGKNGVEYDPDVARDKLRVATRLKLAGTWDRERYGQRIDKNVNVRVGKLASEMTDEELVALIQKSQQQSRTIDGESRRLPDANAEELTI